jgi:hypothetical protein
VKKKLNAPLLNSYKCKIEFYLKNTFEIVVSTKIQNTNRYQTLFFRELSYCK